MKELRKGKNFISIAHEMSIAVATAKVYAIDSFPAGAPLEELLAEHVDINSTSFARIKNVILNSTDRKLRSIKDELKDEYSYNQICFVIA